MANMFSNLISNFASYFAQGENDVEELETEEEYEELDEFEEEYEETEEFSSKEEEEVTTSSRQNQSEEKSSSTVSQPYAPSNTAVADRNYNMTRRNYQAETESNETSTYTRPRILPQKIVKESNVSPLQNRQETALNQQQFKSETEEKTTIVLKYPRRYEDAPEIVDLLIENECILIDFQFMLDAQARRCLDYLDGASHVLYGKLQKVGSTMYLLTPMNVTVDIEEMSISNSNSNDLPYDYDLKLR